MTRKRKKCYLCGQKVPKKAFSKLGWDILQCPACSLYSLKFKDNYFKFIKVYYNEKFFTGSDERAGYVDYEGDSLAETRNLTKFLHRIKQYKKAGSLLDVGCATGLFLEQAKKIGFKVCGFDVSDYAIKIARMRLGKRVQVATLSSAKYKPKQFDVITMFDVVEHLNKPISDLKKMKKYLKDDGMLVINTGDAASHLAKIEGPGWHFFIPPQHFYYFSSLTIRQLLSKAGFTVVKIQYPGKWLILRYFLNLYRQIYKNKLGDFLYRTVGQSPLGKMPIYLNLFDNMLIFAVKTKKTPR